MADEAAAVVVGVAADQIALDHARLIDEDAAGHLEVKPAFGHGRHPPALHAAGVGWDLDAVADAGHRLIFGKEVPRDPHEVLVVPSSAAPTALASLPMADLSSPITITTACSSVPIDGRCLGERDLAVEVDPASVSERQGKVFCQGDIT